MINRSLLDPTSYQQMLTPVLPKKTGSATGYGLGVDVGKRDGRKLH